MRARTVPAWAQYPGVKRRRVEAGSEGDAGSEIDEGSLRRLFEDDTGSDVGVETLDECIALHQRWACFAEPPSDTDADQGAVHRVRMTIREAQLFHMHSRDAVHAWEASEEERRRKAGREALSQFSPPGATRGPQEAIAGALQAAAEREREDAAQRFQTH